LVQNDDDDNNNLFNASNLQQECLTLFSLQSPDILRELCWLPIRQRVLFKTWTHVLCWVCSSETADTINFAT